MSSSFVAGASRSVVAGIAGSRRNAAVALCRDGQIAAFCEEERATRARRVGLPPGALPVEALTRVLEVAGLRRADVTRFALGEAAIEVPDELGVSRVDHHEGHAVAAFQTSAYDEAVVLVCDRHSAPELTVWRGQATGLERLPFAWTGPGFASVYGLATEAMGFAPDEDAHRVEALARVAGGEAAADLPGLSRHSDHLEVSPGFQAALAAELSANGHADAIRHRAGTARRVQQHLGRLLVELVGDVHRTFGGRAICLGGGLFYNSYFTTLVAQSGIFEQTFVPVNPGNAGVALGAALAVGRQPSARGSAVSPFLGPAYANDAIKATLDNCKLSYDYLDETALIEQVAGALAKGRLVGWFQGRMEWGARALGNRSILANPVDPYVLENLNVFLKHRQPHRCYSVSVCAEDAARFFRGPAASPFMEFDYEVIDRDRLRPLLPLDATQIRVQTVAPEAGLFHRLLKAFGALTGVPVLVNTSYNGFNEPIVCTPRDAVRVFFGTGLDMAVLGNWVLRK